MLTYLFLPTSALNWIDMTASQLKIASTIDQYYDEGEPMGIYGVKYKEAITKLEQQAREEVVSGMKLSKKKKLVLFFLLLVSFLSGG